MDYSLEKALLGDWAGVIHTLFVGTLCYFGVVFWLRVFGKRTLSKWNSFDFIVTIALGSILASAVLTKGTSFVQTMAAIALLVGLQFIMTWLSVRTGIVQTLIKSEPSLLLFKGQMIEETLTAQRIAKGEVLAAIRLKGKSCIEEIDAVVLETDGTFSVIPDLNVETATAFRDVRGFKQYVHRT